MPDQTEGPLSGTGFLLRVYWMFVGNALLIFLLVFILEKHPSVPSLLDAAYLGAVASLILSRYVDIRFLNGQTGEGNPATMTHWRRYAMLVGAVGVGTWLIARVLAHCLKQGA